jgi:hypothetical protein
MNGKNKAELEARKRVLRQAMRVFQRIEAQSQEIEADEKARAEEGYDAQNPARWV